VLVGMQESPQRFDWVKRGGKVAYSGNVVSPDLASADGFGLPQFEEIAMPGVAEVRLRIHCYERDH